MTIPYTPADAAVLPLGVDPTTRGLITLDLAQDPHLLVAGWTGSGITSVLRLVVAHMVANGATITIVDPKRVGFEVLADVPGITIARDHEDIADAIAAVHDEITRRYTAGWHGPRHLLAIDGLPNLFHYARSERDRELQYALGQLPDLLVSGRDVGCHLATDITPFALRKLGPEARERAGALVLGKHRRAFLDDLGVHLAQQRAVRGRGVLRTAGTTGRAITLAYLTEEQARTVALPAPVTG
ncbi:FtsK/SpoIIIE domain-containing protein [Streptomyces sp. NPDC001262]|uniref:FtsK/SpoIIIE domain-containing protein n=1 Tax=Streptomyces sp. NPDC001262 TaxID=3364552 RepID=UPI00368DFF81